MHNNSPIRTFGAAIAVSIILIAAFPAYAYLDPGSGSYIIQILAASFLGALFAFKSFWMKAVSALTRRLSRKKKDDPQQL